MKILFKFKPVHGNITRRILKLEKLVYSNIRILNGNSDVRNITRRIVKIVKLMYSKRNFPRKFRCS